MKIYILFMILLIPAFVQAVNLAPGECKNITDSDNTTVEFCALDVNGTNSTLQNISSTKTLKLIITDEKCQLNEGDTILQEIDKYIDSGTKEFNLTFNCESYVCNQENNVTNQTWCTDHEMWALVNNQMDVNVDLMEQVLQEGNKFEQNRLLYSNCNIKLEDCQNDTTKLIVENSLAEKKLKDADASQTILLGMMAFLVIVFIIGSMKWAKAKGYNNYAHLGGNK